MKKNKIIIVLLCLILVMSVFAACAKSPDGGEDDVAPTPTGDKSLDLSAVSEVANVYSVVRVSACKGKWGNATYPVQASVTTPSGKTENTKSDFTLTEEGNYSVKFSANIGGEEISETKTISASGYSAASLLQLNNASFVAEKVDISDKVSSSVADKSGARISMNANSVVTLDKIVDLNEVDGNLVEFLPNYLATTRDFKGLKLVITDAYDSSNFLEVNFRLNTTIGAVSDDKLDPGAAQLFMSVTFNGVTTANANIGGVYDTVVCFNQNFLPYFNYKNSTMNAANNYPVQVRFDNSTNSFYTMLSDGEYLVMDTDDPRDDYADFKGFTTGEVRLSLHGMTGSGDIVLTKIGDTVLSDVSLDDYKQANNGFLLNGYDIDNMLSGFVGYGYKVPTRMNGVVTKLYVKQTGQTVFTEISDKLTSDGFVPEVAGEYYLRYRITNDYGYSRNRETARFRVYESPAEGNLEIKSLFEGKLSAKLFDLFEIPSISFVGGSGELNVEYKLIVNGAERNVAPGEKVVIDGKNASVALKTVVTDQMGYGETFDFPVEVDNNVVRYALCDTFDEISVMYGDELVVPDYVAVDYSQADVSSNNIELTVRQGKSKQLSVGERIIVYGDTDIYYCNAQGEVKLTLKVNCVPETVDIDDEGGKTIAEQFGNVVGVASVRAEEDGTFFVFDGTEDAVSFTMPYALSSSNLALTFGVLKSTSLSAVKMTFADMRGYEFFVTLRDFSDKPTAYVNGVATNWVVSVTAETFTSGNYAGKQYYMYTLIVDGGQKAILNSYESLLHTLTEWSNGVAFDGFEKCAAMLSFEVSGATDNEVFILNTVSNQTFTKAAFEYGDRIVPALAFDGTISSGIVDIGTSFVVPRAYAYDVLSYSSTITMSVITPSGAYVYKNVSPRECEIHFTEYGRYRVSYAIADNGGNGTSRTYTYIFDCYDKVKPQIEVDGSYSAEYKVKDGVKILSAKATDNNGTAKLTVLVYNTKTMDYTSAKIGDVVKLAAGSYKIVYYATDENGNFAKQTFEIIVK